MTEKVQVAVIGGGIVGCSVLYWLAKLGWTDTVLLERRDLTSGSTWHAAGNVTYFGHYSSITKLYVNSVKTYLQAENESGHPVGFHPAGSLRLATSEHELEAYKRLEPLYDEIGVDYAVVGPGELGALHPLLNVAGLHGAAHTPTDGHVDPTGATHALAKAAQQLGARIKRRTPVTGITRGRSCWRLSTPGGEVEADKVVVASSFWAREMVAELGLNLPLYPLEHHEVITGEAPGLAEIGFEVPTVRDPWAPSNTRQEANGFLCGVYEANPKFWAVDGIPADFTEELLAPDMERLEPHLLRVMERLPTFGESGIKSANNV